MDLQERIIDLKSQQIKHENVFKIQQKSRKQISQIQCLWQVPICLKGEKTNIQRKNISKKESQELKSQFDRTQLSLNFKIVSSGQKIEELSENKNNQIVYNEFNIEKQTKCQKINKKICNQYYDPHQAFLFTQQINAECYVQNKIAQVQGQALFNNFIQPQRQYKKLLSKQNQTSDDNNQDQKAKIDFQSYINHGNRTCFNNQLASTYLRKNQKSIPTSKNIDKKSKFRVKPEPDDVFIIIKQKRIKKCQKQANQLIQEFIQIKNQKKNKKYQKIIIKNGRKIYVYKQKYYYPKDRFKTKEQIQFQKSDLYLCQFQMRAEVQNLKFDLPYEQWKTTKLLDFQKRKFYENSNWEKD